MCYICDMLPHADVYTSGNGKFAVSHTCAFHMAIRELTASLKGWSSSLGLWQALSALCLRMTPGCHCIAQITTLIHSLQTSARQAQQDRLGENPNYLLSSKQVLIWWCWTSHTGYHLYGATLTYKGTSGSYAVILRGISSW